MVTIQKAAPCSKGSVASITLENANGMRVTLLSYGATIQSILVPDKDGRMTDVLLGYDRAADYEVNSGYLGACIGRNGNRIAGAAFCLNGRRYTLTANEGKNQLHGGLCGFDKKIWSYTCREDSVEFTTVLADGEEGFPGRWRSPSPLHSTTKTACTSTTAPCQTAIPSPILRTTPTLTSTATAAATFSAIPCSCRPPPSPPRTSIPSDRRDHPRGRHLHGFPRPEDDRQRHP